MLDGFTVGLMEGCFRMHDVLLDLYGQYFEKGDTDRVRMIEDVSGIQEEDLLDRKNVCVTAGASTPPYLSQQVLDTIKKYAESGILEIPEVEIDKIL